MFHSSDKTKGTKNHINKCVCLNLIEPNHEGIRILEDEFVSVAVLVRQWSKTSPTASNVGRKVNYSEKPTSSFLGESGLN